MGITPKDPADFDPTMGNYKDLKPFRFWCQKVLPLVYDDSLSYYELLAKVVDYLNKTMEDVGVLHEDVDALHLAYQQLQAYVNSYFSTLDVQQEINNKLDVMAADGTLDRLLLPYFNEYKYEINTIVAGFENDVNDTVNSFKQTINQSVSTQDGKISTLESRMDTFASLTEGSTTGDAELQDIRVSADGATYPSAGDAVRGQFNLLDKKVSGKIAVNKDLLTKIGKFNYNWITMSIGNPYATPPYDTSNARLHFNAPILIMKDSRLTARPPYQFAVYRTTGDMLQDWNTTYVGDGTYLRVMIVIRRVDEININNLIGVITPFDIFEADDYSAFSPSNVTRDFNVVRCITNEVQPFAYGEIERYDDPYSGINYRLYTYPGDYAGKRLVNFNNNYTIMKYIKAGDTVKYHVNSGYKFARQYITPDNTRRFTEGEWAYYTSDMEEVVNYDSSVLVMLARVNDTEDIDISEGSNVTITIIPKSVNDIVNMAEVPQTAASKWYNKKASFVGDSITYGTGTTQGNIYYELLDDKIDFSSIYADGVGGSCYSVTSNYGSSITPISQRWQNIPTDSDLIVLFAGTNDWGHNTPLGTINDTTDISFYGALYITIKGILEDNPGGRLVLFTPLHRWGFGDYQHDTQPNGRGLTLKDYVDAIKNMCEMFGVPVIDLFGIASLNPRVSAIKTAYVPDGLHPNSGGHHLMADRIYGLLETM